MQEASSSAVSVGKDIEDWEIAYEARKGTIISPVEWKERKGLFEDLYMRKSTLDEVRKELAIVHDFYATTAQCKKMISTWKLSKNIKEEQWKLLVGLQKKRKETKNKETAFWFRGKPVDEKKIKRAESRYKKKNHWPNEHHSMHSDSLLHLITYRTPGSDSNSPHNISELLSPPRVDDDKDPPEDNSNYEEMDQELDGNQDIDLLEVEDAYNQFKCLKCQGDRIRVLDDVRSLVPHGKFLQCIACQETFRLRKPPTEASNLEIKRVVTVSPHALINAEEEELERFYHHVDTADFDSVTVRQICWSCQKVFGTGISLLSAASIFTIPGAVKRLIDSGADVNTRDLGGDTPLHWAALAGNTEIVELLLNAGADKNASNDMGLSPLDAAILGSSVNSVRALLKRKPDLANGPGLTTMHPLLMALRYSTPNIVRLFLVANPNIENIFGRNKSTPLLEAILNDRNTFQLCKLILARKPQLESRNEQGETAVLIAARIGRLDVLNLLLHQRAQFETADLRGRTPLMHAAESGDVEIAKILLNAGASPDTIDAEGATALILAAENGSLFVAALLLKFKASTEALMQGKTAMVWAAENRFEDMIELLVDKDASVETFLDIVYSNDDHETATFGLNIAIRKKPWKYGEWEEN